MAKNKVRDYYRSPLDEVVSNASYSAKTIARKMGITYHRMVALRRVRDQDEKDLKLCKKAISQLENGNTKPLQEVEEPNPRKQRPIIDCRASHASALLLGHTTASIKAVRDHLQTGRYDAAIKALDNLHQHLLGAKSY